MLAIDPASLWAESQSAERFRDLHLCKVDEMVREYCGEGYREDWQGLCLMKRISLTR